MGFIHFRCSNSTSPIVCCNNYHLNEAGDGCKECDPGYFEHNCSSKCPEGYFGELCGDQCKCTPGQLCHHVIGCKDVSHTVGTLDQGHCPDKENGCCVNYYKKGNSCIECFPGYYDYNCSKTCPDGFFGGLCASKCLCNPSLCNHVNGCSDAITSTEENYFTEDLLLSWNGYVLPTVTAVGSLVGLIIIIGLMCYCIRRKVREGYEPKHINNASQRQASYREEQSGRRQCNAQGTPPCEPRVTCGETSGFFPENSENPYAQISDTARLMPRTKHTPKEVGIPKAPRTMNQPNAPFEDFTSYDVLSLKAKGKGKSDSSLSKQKTGFSGVKYSKNHLPPIVKNKPLPPINSPSPNVRKSFLFPGDTSDYLKQETPLTNDRSSEAEIKELPLPPAPPSSAHINGFHYKPKKGKKPPPLPRKPPSNSDIYRDNSDGEGYVEQSGTVSTRPDNETESKSKKKRTSFLMPNKFLRSEPSMKTKLKKDMLNRRKTNGLSYNLSGLLDVEEMPPPDFSDDEEARGGAQGQFPGVENPTNPLRKCQTVIKNKMNRISALKFASSTLDNLRYSFARPQH
ncbi:multiple epidermal growth factor-like domains protein 11 [Saccostrea echinata]|uniref:multiple epidermal growth factor-like domains protein 11 n=1 Tax=Saccostrea echinata TaxID=191078 RepID=UPI002A84160A|nr:multiple epidermal growth factor-like domains protein 11 [Saccostrea echinata]